MLQRYGVPVVYPAEQTCCGQPAFNSGYWEEARRVIRHFCDVFEPHRWIVCPSGSCTAMCRVFFGHADPDPRIVGIGRRVFELTEFLHDMLGVTDTGATFPHKVTMHIGCHGRRELGVVDPPMRLLRSVRGLTYCELPNIDECCGFGGTFSVKMPGTSLAMGGDEGREHRPQRRRGGGIERHQLPDAHRRHAAAQSRHATYPHHAHRRGAGGRLGRGRERTNVEKQMTKDGKCESQITKRIPDSSSFSICHSFVISNFDLRHSEGLMLNFTYHNPVKIVFGKGSIAELPKLMPAERQGAADLRRRVDQAKRRVRPGARRPEGPAGARVRRHRAESPL